MQHSTWSKSTISSTRTVMTVISNFESLLYTASLLRDIVRMFGLEVFFPVDKWTALRESSL